MPSASVEVKVESTDIEAVIRKIDTAVGVKAIDKGLRAAAKIVQQEAKRLCPRSETTGTRRSTNKELAETIGMVVRKYSSGNAIAVVGPEYPAGAHGHLVEFGHRIVTHAGVDTGKRATPHPFLRPAADTTTKQQEEAMLAELKKAAPDEPGET